MPRGDPTHEAAITLRLGDRAELVASALSPETAAAGGGDVPKTHARVEAVEGELRLLLAASDAASLRAAVNSYLRWTRAALDVSGSATSDALSSRSIGDEHGR